MKATFWAATGEKHSYFYPVLMCAPALTSTASTEMNLLVPLDSKDKDMQAGVITGVAESLKRLGVLACVNWLSGIMRCST